MPNDPDSHLSTDHLKGDLEQRSVRNSAATITLQAVQFVVALGSTMVLARLLTPSDFGLLAMVSALTSVVTKFQDFGLPTAMVYEPKIDHIQISRLFWLNLKRNGLLAAFMVAIAPLVSWFYNEQSLTPIIVLITAGMFFTGLTRLHVGLLRRQMRFGILSVTEVGSLLGGVVTGIVLALQGAGYWALVFQQLVILITQAGFLWFACGWRPASRHEIRRHSDSDLQSILSYGRYSTFASLLSHIGSEFDRILLGRFAGSAQLGLYQSAQRLSTFPIASFYLPLKNVTLAGSSRLQDEPDRYRAYARNAFLAAFTVSMLILSLLYINAHDIILFFLGPKWLEVIPMFRILAIAAFADCVNRMTAWIYLSEGQTKRRFTWTLISTPLMIGGIAAGVPWGAIGVATGYAATMSVLVIPSVFFCLKTSRLRGQDLWAAIWRPASASLIASGLAIVLRPLIPSSDFLPLRLLVHTATFGVLYLGLWLALPGGGRSVREIIHLIKSSRASAIAAGNDRHGISREDQSPHVEATYLLTRLR